MSGTTDSIVWAIDGKDSYTGEVGTLYLRRMGGSWFWWPDAPVTKQAEFTGDLPVVQQRWWTNLTDPYEVLVSYTPAILTIRKLEI